MSDKIREFKLKPIKANGAENAYLVSDYPYGFRMRTQIRYWREYKKGMGFRIVSQTLNPKSRLWNKPKAGTYSTLAVLGLDEQGHVKSETLSAGGWDDGETIRNFLANYGGILEPIDFMALDYIEASNRVNAATKWTIRNANSTEPAQTIDEQRKIIRDATIAEMVKPGVLAEIGGK